MLEEKRKFKKILYSKTTFFVLCVLLFFVGRATWRVYQKEQESRKNLEISDRQMDDLKKRDVYLAAEIAKLSTPHGVEEEIRQKFRVAKEGEQMAVIVGAPTSTPVVTDDGGAHWWTRFWNWLQN